MAKDEIPTTEIPTRKEAIKEAQLLSIKLLLCPDKFTILEMSRLNEILTNEGLLE